jgi:hypothetical protein
MDIAATNDEGRQIIACRTQTFCHAQFVPHHVAHMNTHNCLTYVEELYVRKSDSTGPRTCLLDLGAGLGVRLREIWTIIGFPTILAFERARCKSTQLGEVLMGARLN